MSDTATCPDPKVGLPEGSIIEGEIRIVSYFNEQGEEMYAFSRSHDLVVSRVIGLVEMVKTVMVHELVHSYEGDYEEDE